MQVKSIESQSPSVGEMFRESFRISNRKGHICKPPKLEIKHGGKRGWWYILQGVASVSLNEGGVNIKKKCNKQRKKRRNGEKNTGEVLG
ncbi:hypothetical protein TNCV_1134271 [Trichonephila clavipes]|nr:hypothetical protein TNCV_1134271 [Trichonephila clavipes]